MTDLTDSQIQVREQDPKTSYLERAKEALQSWTPEMGKEKFKRITGDDYSQKEGYSQHIAGEDDQRPWTVTGGDGIEVSKRQMSEYWKGGQRKVAFFSNGDVEVYLSDDYSNFSIHTFSTNEGKSLLQETRCSLSEARRNSLSPLIEGHEEFFNFTNRLFYSNDMSFVERLQVKDIEGQRKVEPSLSARVDIYQGDDTYELTVVEEDHGKVKWGRMTHGIGLGFSPSMREVK